jgi:HTH-type transcriptional regulator / antitoxin HigA
MSDTILGQSGFQPTWVSSPGETIADVLRSRNLTIAQFRDAIGQNDEGVAALLEGRVTITIALARRLSTVLGASVQFWMSRDYLYRQSAGRLQEALRDWIDSLPIGDMIRFGWITPAPRATEEVSAALHFFNVPSVQAWHQAYGHVEGLAALRTSATYQSRPGAIAAWLREGERRASGVASASWDPTRFREILQQIRSLTRIGDPQRYLPLLVTLCASAGVVMVPLRAPTGCRASGATRFLTADKALLLISFRYLSEDHFWYTFFHEAGHLLLHSSSQLFVEELDELGVMEDAEDSSLQDNFASAYEREADDFAFRTLIPPEIEHAFLALRADAKTILRFASEAGISPGIVVGQLQHVGRLRRNQLNSLKRRYVWTLQGIAAAREARQPRNAR